MKKKLFFIVLLSIAFFFTGCDCMQQEEAAVPGFPVSKTAPLSVRQSDFTIDGELGTFTPTWESRKLDDGVILFTLTLKSPKAVQPPKFSVKWSTPSIDIHGFWLPRLSLDKSTYWGANVKTRAVRYAPVITLYDINQNNRITYAISDTLNSIHIGTWLKEEDIHFHHYIHFFSEKTPAIEEYKVSIRVDTRRVFYSEALAGVSQWWERLPNHTPAPVPEFAKVPMYSTWYSFHQNISADEVVHQCKLAKPLGFDAVIVDDGWQTLDSKRGYAFCGDWKPERIPKMKEFVERVHKEDMKFLLWYSVPLVGEKSQNYSRFKGKYLYYWEGQGAYVLDPRYPEVRKFIIDTYIKALNDWNLDGFKLDFMGMFRSAKDTVFTARNGRDFASIDRAVDRLMTDIMGSLRKIRPDIMIEFRQPYIGPLMRKYGNMFRAADCPNMALVNRVRTTDVRLLSGNTAVHSDMFRWHDNEPVETAALQILNILFSVPQLSVKIDNFSQDHKDMIKHWTEYWKKNRNVLLDGKFIPIGPQENYPILRGETPEKTIIALYTDRLVTLPEKLPNTIHVVNGKKTTAVVLDIPVDLGNVKTKIFDCRGKLHQEREVSYQKGIQKFHVPPAGLLEIHRL